MNKLIEKRDESRYRPDAADAWDFCVAEYGRPGVAEALLKRQDDEGLDVMLHLFCRYASECLGLVLDEQAVAEAAAATAAWRKASVLPLRELRRALKPAAQTDPRVHRLREKLKSAELDAERVQLEQLCAWLAGRIGSAAALRA